jgi:hypothetical protein
VAYWVKAMGQEGGKSYVQNIAETLNYLATLFPGGKVFVQLIYDVATLSGLQALVGSIDSMLSTVSGRPPTCDFEKELNRIEYLISDAISEMGMNKLKLDSGKSPDVERLGQVAVVLANETGRLQSLLAYKIVNCLITAFSTVQALERALALAQVRQNQNQPSGQNQPPSQPAPTAKATATG